MHVLGTSGLGGVRWGGERLGLINVTGVACSSSTVTAVISHFVSRIECKPAFTKTPSSNGKVYVDEGTNRFALSWDFNTDGETVNWVDLMYKKSGAPDVLIARKVGNQLQVPKTSNYYGRVTAGTGKATFVLWYIAQSDERTFECKVYFSSVTNPWIMNAVNLIVVGKSSPTVIIKIFRLVIFKFYVMLYSQTLGN